MTKQAVQFGAGNIGRALVAPLLSEAGYTVTFVDVSPMLVALLNDRKQYTVVLHGTGAMHQKTVRNVRALSAGDLPAVSDAVRDADIVCTAVGPAVLPQVARPIAQGMIKRAAAGSGLLTVIACENVQGNSSLLRRAVLEAAGRDWPRIATRAVFPDCLVDRIVPASLMPSGTPTLEVRAEEYYEFLVDKTVFRHGEAPQVPGWTYTNQLPAEFIRKLYLVNGFHAVLAFLGARAGAATIDAALDFLDVRREALGALEEIQAALVAHHGFEPELIKQRALKILKRFSNHALADDVLRVGRNPRRKLGYGERIFGPMEECWKSGIAPRHLARAAAAGFAFKSPSDAEAVALNELVAKRGIRAACAEVSGFPEEHELVSLVVKAWDELPRLTSAPPT